MLTQFNPVNNYNNKTESQETSYKWFLERYWNYGESQDNITD